MDKKRKLETNARYLAKFKRVPVSVPLDEWDAVQQAAAAAGQSASAYMLQAVRDRVARETAPAGLEVTDQPDGAKSEEEGGYGG